MNARKVRPPGGSGLGLLIQFEGERVMAAGRIALALVVLAAIVIDLNPEPGAARWLPALLTGYALYAAALAFWAWRRPTLPLEYRVATHLLDVAVFTAIPILSGGGGTPFFVLLVLVMAGGALRLPLSLQPLNVLVVLLGLVAIEIREPSFASLFELDPTRLLVRAAAVGLFGLLLTRFAARREHFFNSLDVIATWPAGGDLALEETLAGALGASARLYGAPQAVLIWEEPDEPWVYTAIYGPDGLRISRDPPSELSAIAPEFAREAFVCFDVRTVPTKVLRLGQARPVVISHNPVSARICDALAFRAALAAPVDSAEAVGHLLVLDPETVNTDALVISLAVARQVGGSLDRVLVARRLANAAMEEERGRLLRDLHDGILQVLTGVGLRLRELRGTLVADPVPAERVLDELEGLLAAEQRDLRMLVMEERSGAGPGYLGTRLAERLRDIAKRQELTWGLGVEMHVDDHIDLPNVLGHEVVRIVQEGLSNSVRHGRAKRSRVDVVRDRDAIQVRMEDDGIGFPFEGAFDDGTLSRMQLGPVVLKQRVHTLGGTLSIDSRPSRVVVTISIPIVEMPRT